jgi:hypothetical protein
MSPSSSSLASKAAILLFVLITAVTGLAIAMSPLFLSYGQVKSHLDTLAATKQAPFAEETYHTIMSIAPVAGSALGVLALGVALLRARLEQWLARLQSDGRIFWLELHSNLAWWAHNEGREGIPVLTALILGGMVLRLMRLNEPVSYDEAYSFIYYASKPLYLALSYYSSTNNHLFYTFLLHLSTGLFGEAEWVLRLPSFVASVLMIPLTFFVARASYDRSTAIFAAALIAGGSPFVDFGVAARGYSVQLFILVASLGLSLFLVIRRNAFAWLLLVVLTALGFYTIPTYFLPYGVVAVWMALCIALDRVGTPRVAFLRDLVVANACAAVLTLLFYSPVLVVSGVMKPVGYNLGVSAHLLPFSWSGFVDWLGSLWHMFNLNALGPLRYVLASALTVGVVAEWRTQRCHVPLYLAALCWLIPVTLVFQSFFYERIWVFADLILSFLTALGISFVGRRIGLFRDGQAGTAVVGLTLFALLAAQDVVRFNSGSDLVQDGPAIFAVLDRKMKPDDVVLRRYPFSAPLEYHWRRKGTHYLVIRAAMGEVSPEELYAQMDRKPDNLTGRRLFIIVCPEIEPLEGIFAPDSLDWLRKNGLTIVKRFDTSTLYVAGPFR